MRYRPGESEAFDAQMRAIAAMPVEARLRWLDERRASMWALASEATRARWVQRWLENPHHVTREDLERAGARARGR